MRLRASPMAAPPSEKISPRTVHIVACIRCMGGEKPPPVRKLSRAYFGVCVAIAAIVVGLFVWQPWNSNGQWWGK